MVRQRENRYSRFVKLVKILLPLAALALLSTLFLFSRHIDPTASIPYAKIDIDQILKEPRIGQPHYTGLTRDGTAISVTALSARPDPGDTQRASAETLAARLDFGDGSTADITAATGDLDTGAGQLDLHGNVVIETSGGYRLRTEQLRSALDATRVTSHEQVYILGPLGELTADSMEISQNTGNPGRHVAVFKGGVKLIYTPQTEKD